MLKFLSIKTPGAPYPSLFIFLFIDKLNGVYYCFVRNIINLIFKREYKLSYVKFNQIYKKIYSNGQYVYYSDKKRAVRIHLSFNDMINKLIYSYCLENITFEDNDVIIDCGANVGELGLFFTQKNLNVRYIGFEPSKKEYLVCKLNNPESEILNLGLWNEKNELNFYIKSDTADSSLFQIEDYIDIDTINVDRLDNIIDSEKYQFIKLLKIDAEGAEPEILMGASKLLNKIKYITVDVGPERGLSLESPTKAIIEILFKNNFALLYENLERPSMLFENQNINQ